MPVKSNARKVINPFDRLTPIHTCITLLLSGLSAPLGAAGAPRVNGASSDTFFKSQSKHLSKSIPAHLHLLRIHKHPRSHRHVFHIHKVVWEMTSEGNKSSWGNTMQRPSRSKVNTNQGAHRFLLRQPPLPLKPPSLFTCRHLGGVFHLLKLRLETIISCFTVTLCPHPFCKKS